MKKERILIVEDEMDLLDLVDYNLTRKGYITQGAMDGEEAIVKTGAFDPDLIVLDLMLPKVDGWEVCRRLRQAKKDLMIIMLTAKCMPDDKVKGFEAGADDYITKPFSVTELLIRVDKLLENRRQNDMQKMFFHEMSNRISAIGCFSDILSKKDKMLSDEKKAIYMKSLGQQVSYTTELISAVGSLISIESQKLELALGYFDIRPIVEEVCMSYKAIAAHKDVTIAVSIDEGLPEVKLNPMAAKQVLANIAGNAVKYSGAGGMVHISAEVSGDKAVISVKDNGCGIPAEDIAHIFGKGYRAANAVEKVSGSGLGLYIARSLADKMGAAIDVKSIEGKGSEFMAIFQCQRQAGIKTNRKIVTLV